MRLHASRQGLAAMAAGPASGGEGRRAGLGAGQLDGHVVLHDEPDAQGHDDVEGQHLRPAEAGNGGLTEGGQRWLSRRKMGHGFGGRR